MILGIHSWKIDDKEIKNKFINDWKRVTLEVAKPSGNKFAKLFKFSKTILISVTIWSSRESWLTWKEGMKNLPERILYRNYKLKESFTFKIGK